MLEIYKLLEQDLQLTNRWSCYFGDLLTSSFMVKNVNLPFEKLVTETTKYGEKNYISFTAPETVTLTFFENTRFEIYNYFKTWKDIIFDPKTKTFNVLPNKDLKYRSATITFYSSKQVQSAVKFKMEKLMILGLDELNLDQENSIPLEWSVQLAVRDVTSEISSI